MPAYPSFFRLRAENPIRAKLGLLTRLLGNMASRVLAWGLYYTSLEPQNEGREQRKKGRKGVRKGGGRELMK